MAILHTVLASTLFKSVINRGATKLPSVVQMNGAWVVCVWLMVWCFVDCIIYQYSETNVMHCLFSLELRASTCVKGPGSSVGIATDYGLDGPGIESRWGENFRTRPDQPWGPPSLLYNGYRVFPGGKAARVWCWPPTHLLAPRSWKSRAIPLLPL
jgi:hypothetical protein